MVGRTSSHVKNSREFVDFIKSPGDGGCGREDAEERALESFHSPPRFWKRYADDTITALPRNIIAPFLDHLNDIEPSIRFTKEEEGDGQLAFLDVLYTA